MKMFANKKEGSIAFALLLMLVGFSLNAQDLPSKLDNPISKTYLKNNLRKASPRLVLNKA